MVLPKCKNREKRLDKKKKKKEKKQKKERGGRVKKKKKKRMRWKCRIKLHGQKFETFYILQEQRVPKFIQGNININYL